MKNCCVTNCLDGFVHYLVTAMICRGYWWYVTGRIPDNKPAEQVDEKLVSRYEADLSSATRWRRKKMGKANVRYLRHDRFFVLMATRGTHPFFQEESGVKDIRKVPIRVGGYSISFRRDSRTKKGGAEPGYRVHVRIDEERFKELVAQFEHLATRMSADRLAARLYRLPYRGYAPVRRQLCRLLRTINKRRRRAGLSQLSKECLFFHRTPVKVFAHPAAQPTGAPVKSRLASDCGA